MALEPRTNSEPQPRTPSMDRAIASLSGDRAKAKLAEPPVDMTVLGIPLGQPLTLPDCRVSSSTANVTCVHHEPLRGGGSGDALDQIGGQIAGFEEALLDNIARDGGDLPITSVPLATRMVSIAPSERPEWLAFARVDVTTVDGYVLKISVGPLRSHVGAIDRLSAKYGGAPQLGQTLRCTNEFGVVTATYQDRHWRRPGVTVSLVANARLSGCGISQIDFETDTYRVLKAEARQRFEASQPKL